MMLINHIRNSITKWKSIKPFLYAQIQIGIILTIAKFGNEWKDSYPRNDNHDMKMFWCMIVFMLVVAMCTIKHTGSKGGVVVVLNRNQTEEWKGWMQWVFIMYHYYRAYPIYNTVRTFVSSYVWMTGFGNFLYFDKKKDYSMKRIIGMFLRINYFPLLLSICLGTEFQLYYVVPLHTLGFVISMCTCYVGYVLEMKFGWGYWSSRWTAVIVSLVVHVWFYETDAVEFLKVFGDEIHLRFQIDKYSTWVGILCGLMWKKIGEYMNWAHGASSSSSSSVGDNTMNNNNTTGESTREGSNDETSKFLFRWMQRMGAIGFICLWWYSYGFMTDKLIYNPIHPYIFFLPIFGFLALRNSSRFLTEIHSTALEFLGKMTLETYVLQFHIFMCKDVQHIPIVVPGSGKDGALYLKFLNMVLCGVIFMGTAYWARKVTVTTQHSVVELVDKLSTFGDPVNADEGVDKIPLIERKDSGPDLELGKKKDTGV